MPRGDRTGPMGTGAMSGRAAGFCGGYNMPGYANTAYTPGFGMGMGCRRRGRYGPQFVGYGRRFGFAAAGRVGRMNFGGYPIWDQPVDPKSEKEYLTQRSQALQSELEAINKRLGEYQSEDDPS